MPTDLEDVIFQALTYEISDTAYLRRISRKAAKAVMAETNRLAEEAMDRARHEHVVRVLR